MLKVKSGKMANEEVLAWWSKVGKAMVTDEDAMTKFYLPTFVVEVSFTLTRFRYDVTTHLNLVTDEANVFTHELGMVPKGSAEIIEDMLLDHIIRCCGVATKVVISDNASVGKFWITTVAFPQYVVDQGFADVCVVVFLKHSHGKYAFDMLFLQFQTKWRNALIVSLVGQLVEFEDIRKSRGRVGGCIQPSIIDKFNESIRKTLVRVET